MNEDSSSMPPPPWWNSREARREARHAAREERRRLRDEAHEAAGATRSDAPPRDPITPEKLADAAVRVIDAEGLDGLTVRRLAQELGIGTMTLYWYVQNKDEILDLVGDRLLAAAAFPSLEQDWQVSVRQGAAAVRGALLSHANAVPVMIGRRSLGPNGLRLTEQTLGVFRAAGLDANDAADAYFTFLTYVTGFCVQQTSSVSLPNVSDADMGTYAQMIGQYIQTLPPERYPNLRAAAHRVFTAGPDERFAFGVECLIAGLEARLAAVKAAAHTEGSPS